MAEASTYAQRIAYAVGIRALSVKGGRVTQEWLAQEVSRLSRKQLGQTTAGGWIGGVMPRTIETQVALARALRTDPGWLFYGPELSAAPAPVAPTAEEIRRELHVAATLPLTVDMEMTAGAAPAATPQLDALPELPTEMVGKAAIPRAPGRAAAGDRAHPKGRPGGRSSPRGKRGDR